MARRALEVRSSEDQRQALIELTTRRKMAQVLAIQALAMRARLV